MTRKNGTARRFQPAGTHKKSERDPCLYLLGVQITVCALIILLAFLAADAKPSFLSAFAAGYRELISAKEISLPTEAAALSEEYSALRDTAADAVANLITDLITPIEAPAAEQTGAGGWMGVPAGVTPSVPAACDVTRISLSAAVRPPIGGKVTSTFGYREHPLTGADDFHRGMDIAAAQGTQIRASLPGTVLETDSSAIYGNYITLDHGGGLQTTYCHCETIVARAGERLREGELIATVGSTGISTGPHCHFELQKDGKYFNPAWVLTGMSGDGI